MAFLYFVCRLRRALNIQNGNFWPGQGHICVPAVRAAYPRLPVLHIADCTARAITARGMRRVGLLGTGAHFCRKGWLRCESCIYAAAM